MSDPVPQDARTKARAALPSSARDFFDLLMARTDSEDARGLDVPALIFLTEQALATAQAQEKGESRLVLADDPAGHFSLVIAVNDDRPFLFDSALTAAIAGGARLVCAFHPIVEIGGRPLSVIVFLIDPLVGEEPRAGLRESLAAAFAQGAAAVRDWRAMLARLDQAHSGLAVHAPQGADIAEDLAFLDWLAADHFTFLGARDYSLTPDGAHGRLTAVEGSGLGILADAGARVVAAREQPDLSAAVRAFLDEPDPLIVTKSSAKSLVHRRVNMDYIGVKAYDANGALTGEHRFVGLFTSGAYSLNPREIPLVRKKVAAVTARAKLDPRSHDGKALAHILDTFPRDELFQMSEDELADTALGVLRLGGLPRVRLFLRFDRFDRFVSALVYAPRDRIDAGRRTAIHKLLAQALNGRTTASDVAVDETALVRLHYIIGRNEGPRPPLDPAALEREIAGAIQTWDDGFVQALCAVHGPGEGRRMAASRAADFSPGYRGYFPAHEGARDLDILLKLAAGGDTAVRARAYRRETDAHNMVRLKLYGLGEVLPLSQTLPMFENCGLKVIAEDAFPVSFRIDDGWRQQAHILDFVMEREGGESADLERLRAPLEDVLHAVLEGRAENDGFNRLVIGAELSWREVTILRACAKFLRQAGLSFSLSYMQQTLARNPDVAALLTALFEARTDPQSPVREAETQRLEARIEAALRDVPSLDDDRILRRLRNVIQCVLRTNYFQRGADGSPKPTLSFKLDSAQLDELPAPRPWREVFVYAPEVEAVHLRFGRIARGGIRWSDRREDFRTEILGLVKAQQVKNAVIVPVGAKGGFYPKRMPAAPTREESMAVGIAAYKIFINALLDITDNLAPDGAVIAPADVLRLDGDDPYLVVAADKGTATFSDIANAIAIEHGFWLGDAFASGGSHGYDHKKMGITARGAWEAIKRHFRELGSDIQAEDFTVVGVGDMSGDVFGNGMLLSRHIRLLAAFDHRHIFLDPEGDAEISFKERERLFTLPRSSWDDYDKSLIGPGGGVFARSLKEIPLTAQVQKLIGSTAASLSPPALINALLKAEVDLLWFGGIGTYIKAAAQSQLEAGDRANDSLRVDGGQVRAKVVGEGANLGVTQAGRIEYARTGGRIDTDAVDNSAGVDTSDHEVNLKILLSGPARRGDLPEDKRDALLAAMTDDVAALVLQDNYDQTLALSVAEASAVADLDAASRFITDLEARGKLDRAVEFLPSESEMRKLAHDGLGLSRPQLCVALAYAKLDLDAAILESALPDDAALADLLTGYFPPAALAAFPDEAPRHRLRREIVSTALCNRIVNLAGPVFVLRMRELSGLGAADVARGFVIADRAFGLSALKARIDALDGKVEAGLQTRLYAGIAAHFRRVTPWFLSHAEGGNDLAAAIALYKTGVEALRPVLALAEADKAHIETRAKQIPEDLARDWSLLRRLVDAPDIARLAHRAKAEPDCTAALYAAVGTLLGLDRLRTLSEKIALPEHWDRLAVRRLLDDLGAMQSGLTSKLLVKGPQALKDWEEDHAASLARTTDLLAAIESAGELSVAKLMLASSQIQGLAGPNAPG